MTETDHIHTDAAGRNLVQVTLTYGNARGIPQELVIKDLTYDDTVHVLTGLQARCRTHGQARLTATAALNAVRQTHFEKAEEDTREAVESALGGWRWLLPRRLVDAVVDAVMAKVGAIQPDWAVDLYDTHVRALRLGARLKTAVASAGKPAEDVVEPARDAAKA